MQQTRVANRPHAGLPAAAHCFLRGEPAPGPMFEEFCTSGLLDPGDLHTSGVARASIFEFSWGFVAELRGGGSRSWNLYAQHAWRTGTREWWDAIDAGHQRLVQHALASARRDGMCRGLRFERGERAFSAASYVTNSESAAGARVWLGRVLLPDLWPRLLRATFDPVYETNAFVRQHTA